MCNFDGLHFSNVGLTKTLNLNSENFVSLLLLFIIIKKFHPCIHGKAILIRIRMIFLLSKKAFLYKIKYNY